MLFDHVELISETDDSLRKDVRANARTQSHSSHLLEGEMVQSTWHHTAEHRRADPKGVKDDLGNSRRGDIYLR
jgi:hypothetical protein